MPAVDQPAILLICADLLFASRVTATAGLLRLAVHVLADPAEAAARLAGEHFGLVIVDLATPGLSIARLTASLPIDPRPRVVAFGPHVQTELLHAARQAGCDVVLPRSRFAAELPQILAGAARLEEN
jgi:DNA-binding NarL/FixJ family response regulator